MNMTSYFRPIVRTGLPRSKNSIFLAETKYWISEAEEIQFGENTKLISINDVPDWWKKRWLKKRSKIYSKAMYNIDCNNLTKTEIAKKILNIY